MLLRAGCGGFPVGRDRYFKALPTVELSSSFDRLPRLRTAQTWKSEAPNGFDFSMLACRDITHPARSGGYASPSRSAALGHFRPSDAVFSAWEETRSVVEALGARFLVFVTPPSFYPDANHLRDMYRFFKSARRGAAAWVWQAQGTWELRLLSKVCGDLGLIRASDPLAAEYPSFGRLNYFRLSRPPEGGFNPEHFRRIRLRCQEKPSYVFFAYRQSWDDARRFAQGL
ncbi:MAG: DUF72 domain-containing protein [Elusimicrobia bacterium]|nr:DUF72 domain-containing protein [Elusimicrobiota bacterium]